MDRTAVPAVFAQTNDADRNEVVAFRRSDDGMLEPLGRCETGGRGSGKPHLPSQGSLALARDGRLLLAANAGSGDVSAFAVADDGLALVDRVPAGGASPVSVAAHGDLAYVLHAGGIAGFGLAEDGRLSPLEGSARPLSDAAADPAQIAFAPDGRTLVVTERGTDAISLYAVGEDGLAAGPTSFPSSGATPYGFDFAAGGVLVVTEAFGGAVGAAAASSYRLAGDRLEPVSPSVGDTRSEVCWAVATKDGRFVYVTNFGDGTVSRYAVGDDGSLELADPVAASTVLGEKGIRDAARSADGRFVYALDADARKVFGWRVADDGALAPLGAVDGLPATVAGLAAS